MQPRRDLPAVLPGRLRPFAPFDRLGSELLILAASHMQAVELRDGDTLIGRGTEDPHDYFLLEGSLVLTDAQGVSTLVHAGGAEAATPLAAVRPSLYQVSARGRARCARIARSQLAELRALASDRAPACAAVAAIEVAEDDAATAPDLSATQDLAAGIAADIAADRLRLPSLPDLAVRLRSALGRRNCTNERVAELIGADPAIAAKILRLANSPLCRGRARIEALPDAVARIGPQTVSELVICFALKDLFNCPDPQLRAEFAERTGEAVRVGACAAVIAERVAPALGDRALVAGLVSDVGAIPVLQRIAEQGLVPAAAARIRDLADRLAPGLGELICRRWDLGEAVAAAVRHGRDWGHAGNGAVTLTELVVCARYHTWLGLGRRLPPAEQVPALAVLGAQVSPQRSLDIVREARSRIDVLMSLLS